MATATATLGVQLGPEDRDLEETLKAVRLNESFDTIIVVDGLPKVTADKEAKLMNLIRKLFRVPASATEAISMPRGADGVSKGFAFIEYANAQHAAAAVRDLNNYKLDKAHELHVTSFADLQRAMTLPAKFEEPTIEPFVEREHMKSWLMEPHARDQFVTRHGDDVAIVWGSKDEPEVAYSRTNWSDSYVAWSPQGSYLVTFHRQGVALWGGPSWKKIVRFPHPMVRFADFSPNEAYVVTWSPEPVDPHANEPENIIIWDVHSGRKVRSFHMPQLTSWPAIKWSHDSKYMARANAHGIAVYEVPSMTLQDKRSIKVENLRDFSWSPTDNYLSYWVPDEGDAPARVTVLEIPSRTLVRAKNLFKVLDCKLQWHPEGDFLAVKVDRKAKAKTAKAPITSFEMFRMRDKDVPVEVLEIKDAVVAFNWEPKGERFGLIHGEPGLPTLSVSFYSMDSDKSVAGTKSVRLIKTLERKSCNHLYWSPKGQFVVLAGLKNFNGVLEFWNVDQMEMMGGGDHLMCTDIEWDPSGRYVTSYVSAWRHAQMENGYYLWDFRGKILHQKLQDKFFQLLWRPRPPTLLSKEKQEEIRKNLKQYSVEFKRIDEAKDSRASRAILERRRQLMDEWAAYRKQKTEEVKRNAAERAHILGFEERDEEMLLEEVIEELIEESREVVRDRVNYD